MKLGGGHLKFQQPFRHPAEMRGGVVSLYRVRVWCLVSVCMCPLIVPVTKKAASIAASTRSTIYSRLNVPYGAPAPGKGVQLVGLGGGTLSKGGYTCLLPRTGYSIYHNVQV